MCLRFGQILESSGEHLYYLWHCLTSMCLYGLQSVCIVHDMIHCLRSDRPHNWADNLLQLWWRYRLIVNWFICCMWQTWKGLSPGQIYWSVTRWSAVYVDSLQLLLALLSPPQHWTLSSTGHVSCHFAELVAWLKCKTGRRGIALPVFTFGCLDVVSMCAASTTELVCGLSTGGVSWWMTVWPVPS